MVGVKAGAGNVRRERSDKVTINKFMRAQARGPIIGSVQPCSMTRNENLGENFRVTSPTEKRSIS